MRLSRSLRGLGKLTAETVHMCEARRVCDGRKADFYEKPGCQQARAARLLAVQHSDETRDYNMVVGESKEWKSA